MRTNSSDYRFHKERMKMLRDAKRLREEEKRWNRFLIDREMWDEALENVLDTWEYMELNR